MSKDMHQYAVHFDTNFAVVIQADEVQWPSDVNDGFYRFLQHGECVGSFSLSAVHAVTRLGAIIKDGGDADGNEE